MPKCKSFLEIPVFSQAGWCFSFASLLLLVSLLSGCGKSTKDERTMNLGTLCSLYSQFVINQHGRPPASKEELLEFINTRGARILELRNVEDVESLFISPRDEQPYVIRYGKQAEVKYSEGLVACERIGVDGKRFVGFSNGSVEELAEEEIKARGFKEAFVE